MKLIFLIGLFLSSTLLFQNCAGGGSQLSTPTTGGAVGIDSHQNKVVGLYDLPSVSKVHYYSQVPAPDLTITLNVPSPEADVAIYNAQGAVNCVLKPQLSGDQYYQLLSLLPQTYLSDVAGSDAASCKTQYLEITLKDGSSHTYPFQDGCQPTGDVSIVNPDAQLQAVLLGIIAGSGESCAQ